MTQIPFINNKTVVEATKPTMRYKDGEDFFAWQSAARQKLRELLGIDEILKRKPESDGFKIEYEKKTEEYTEYRFTISSEEGYFFPSVMRVPTNVKTPIPLCITLQGHSTGMHISLGVPKFANDPEMIAGGDRDFVTRALKEGFASVAIEQRNFGECGGNEETGAPQCIESSLTALLAGRTTIGERVVDTMAVIDAILKNFDFIDENKILLMGNSGGGTATFYTAAIDERIALAMPSCAVCTYKASIAAMHHCACNYIPNIAKFFDMGDISGLIAPRPLVIVNGKDDVIFPNDGVLETYEITKKLYIAADASNNCALVTGPKGHRFYADLAWPVANNLLNK